jgi:hypothetical protein
MLHAEELLMVGSVLQGSSLHSLAHTLLRPAHPWQAHTSHWVFQCRERAAPTAVVLTF